MTETVFNIERMKKLGIASIFKLNSEPSISSNLKIKNDRKLERALLKTTGNSRCILA
jgi:hypothetical protein